MIEFSTFKNRYIKEPERLSFPLQTFVKGMTTPVQRNALLKDKLSLWSPTLFDGNRCKNNADVITCLVYDVDDGESEFNQYILFHMWDVIAHTSFSHTPEHPKYRIILPLEHPVPSSDWEKVWRYALQIWELVGAKGLPDMKALKDPARMYYRYALPKGRQEIHKAIFEEGLHTLSLDYSKIELPKKSRARKNYTKERPMTATEAIERTDLRDTIASRSSAVITGNRAHHITCPRCNRNAAYFYIDIMSHHSPMRGWQCNHQNSCGGYGNLAELI